MSELLWRINLVKEYHYVVGCILADGRVRLYYRFNDDGLLSATLVFPDRKPVQINKELYYYGNMGVTTSKRRVDFGEGFYYIVLRRVVNYMTKEHP